MGAWSSLLVEKLLLWMLEQRYHLQPVAWGQSFWSLFLRLSGTAESFGKPQRPCSALDLATLAFLRDEGHLRRSSPRRHHKRLLQQEEVS